MEHTHREFQAGRPLLETPGEGDFVGHQKLGGREGQGGRKQTRAELPWAAEAEPEEAEPEEAEPGEGTRLRRKTCQPEETGLRACSFLASRCLAVERVASQILSQPKSKGNFSDASGDLKTQIKKRFQSHKFSLKHFNRSNLKENIFRNWYEEINS